MALLKRHHVLSELADPGLLGRADPAVDFLVDAAVVKSKREARELLPNSAVSISSRKAELSTRVTADWLLSGKLALIRRGKKTWHVVRFE